MESFDYLNSKRAPYKEIHLSAVPRSAQDVERLYGCPLHQVLKTLVFVGDNGSIVATVPGDKRVNTKKLAEVVRMGSLRIAKPNEVLTVTGYEIGGVTPLGAKLGSIFVIDKSVFEVDVVNIGSGIAEIGIELKSSVLKAVWSGVIADIIE